MKRPATIIIPDLADEPIALVTFDGMAICSTLDLPSDPCIAAVRRDLEAALHDDDLAHSLISGLTKP